MTFKGMLKILMNDYKKQCDEKMFTIANELIRTRRELTEVKEKLHNIEKSSPSTSCESLNLDKPTISVFIQYYELFNELCELRLTMTVHELLVNLRRITGNSIDYPMRLRVLSEDGSTALFFLDKEPNRTLESFIGHLKPRMIISIEDDTKIDDKQSHLQRSESSSSTERTHSYESDV